MNRLMSFLFSCCLVIQANVAFADTSKSFEFEKQNEEVFDLENFLKKTVMVKEQVKGTCQRQVPYEENVCNEVTKYKKECKTIPAHEECKNVNYPICHTETTMEEECSAGPSRQECRNVTVPVCNYETRYEQQCSTGPSRQECRSVPDQVCRNETRYEQQCRTVPGENQCRVVTRYRQECSSVPGGQQCRTIPGDVQCSIVNGENRCVKIPPRQECSQGPSRQECRQVPYEERECSQGPSRQECTQVPRTERVCDTVMRQECRTVPGEYECRQVPRQEQVCHNETQRQCNTVPGDPICRDVPRQHQVCEDNYKKECKTVPAKEECKNVPYKEQVCKMETKYKTEDYECMKEVDVPKEQIVKTHRAAVKVEFNVLSEILGPTFTASLDTKGNLALQAVQNEEATNDNFAVAFVKKDVKADDRGEINDISANYKMTLMNGDYVSYLNTKKLVGELQKYSITFQVNGKVDGKRADLALKICKKDKSEIDKKISKGNISYKYDDKADVTIVTVDLKAEGAKIGSVLGSIFGSAPYNVSIAFSQNYSDAGELILANVRDFTLKLSGDMTLSK